MATATRGNDPAHEVLTRTGVKAWSAFGFAADLARIWHDPQSKQPLTPHLRRSEAVWYWLAVAVGFESSMIGLDIDGHVWTRAAK